VFCNLDPISVSEEADEPEFNVEACLAQVRDGDSAAARALVEHLYPQVIKIVRGHLPRRLDEEDLAQEVFMKIFAKLDGFRGTAPFGHWVSKIALNTCLNRLRSEKVRPELRFADLTEDHVAAIEATHGSDPESASVDAEATNDLLAKLLDCLPPQDRMIIQLLELDDLSVDEIVKRTGWSATMIRVRAFRARNKMRKRLVALRAGNESL
jgi:RNA polymerase sigma-70 factor, ECF subfamily